jgi:hypothetical protein
MRNHFHVVLERRLSNGKFKAENNQKCCNKYLAWTFVEAANFSRRYDKQCRRWYDRKAAKTSKAIATKALGCKLVGQEYRAGGSGAGDVRCAPFGSKYGPAISSQRTLLCPVNPQGHGCGRKFLESCAIDIDGEDPA